MSIEQGAAGNTATPHVATITFKQNAGCVILCFSVQWMKTGNSGTIHVTGRMGLGNSQFVTLQKAGVPTGAVCYMIAHVTSGANHSSGQNIVADYGSAYGCTYELTGAIGTLSFTFTWTGSYEVSEVTFSQNAAVVIICFSIQWSKTGNGGTVHVTGRMGAGQSQIVTLKGTTQIPTGALCYVTAHVTGASNHSSGQNFIVNRGKPKSMIKYVLTGTATNLSFNSSYTPTPPAL